MKLLANLMSYNLMLVVFDKLVKTDQFAISFLDKYVTKASRYPV